MNAKKIVHVLFCAAALGGSLVPGALSAAQPSVEQLTRAVIATIRSVPDGSVAAAYEGQVAATLDGSGEPCPIVQQAITQARGRDIPRSAHTALKALQMVFARCGTGTGSVGRSGLAAFSGGPSFSVSGGGSDYRR